jgi:hypothetical protein
MSSEHDAEIQRIWREDHDRNHAEPHAWCPHCMMHKEAVMA